MTIDSIEAVLAPRKEVQRRGAGTSIFRQGELPAGVYFVHEGTVDLTRVSATGEAGMFRVADRGEIIGLGAVVSRRAHECSATARSECELGFVDRAEFLDALEQTPSVWIAILQFLSREVHAAYDELRELVHR